MFQHSCWSSLDVYCGKTTNGDCKFKLRLLTYIRLQSCTVNDWLLNLSVHNCIIKPQAYEVCSNSIRIGIVVVVHWVECVCNQSWHVHTCLSNSWHRLRMAAFAQLAVIGRGSNTCVYVIAIFTMCESTEQRNCIKFCFKIGKTAMETWQLLQLAYGEDAMGHTQVSDWLRRFKEGRTSVESDPHSGRPSTSRNKEMIAKVRTIVCNNKRLTVWEIADDCGISMGSCDAISTDDLHMKHVCAKFVPRLLTDDQSEQRQTIARDLFEHPRKDVQFLKNIVTGDESWIYGYDPERKQQSSQWKGPTSPQPKKACQVQSKTKVCYWRFLILRVLYTTSMLPTGKQLTRNSTWKSCDVCMNQFAEKDRKNDGMATGSCTTTMRPHTLHILCSSFWPNTAPLSCSSRHNHQISHRVTFSYSQGLRKFWKDTNLRQRRTSNEIRQRHY